MSVTAAFNALDKDGNGEISRQEFDEYMSLAGPSAGPSYVLPANYGYATYSAPTVSLGEATYVSAPTRFEYSVPMNSSYSEPVTMSSQRAYTTSIYSEVESAYLPPIITTADPVYITAPAPEQDYSYVAAAPASFAAPNYSYESIGYTYTTPAPASFAAPHYSYEPTGYTYKQVSVPPQAPQLFDFPVPPALHPPGFYLASAEAAAASSPLPPPPITPSMPSVPSLVMHSMYDTHQEQTRVPGGALIEPRTKAVVKVTKKALCC